MTPEDWSGYHALEFDVWCEEAMDLTVRITDPKTQPGSRRFREEKFQLRAGPNTVIVNLDGAAATPAS